MLMFLVSGEVPWYWYWAYAIGGVTCLWELTGTSR